MSEEPSNAAYQFQTTHGRRQLPVMVACSPLISAGGILGGIFLDHKVDPAGIALIAVALGVGLVIFGIRGNRHGMTVGSDRVLLDGPLGRPRLAPITPASPPRLSTYRDRDYIRMRITDVNGKSATISWLALVRKDSPWRWAFGGPNELLMRDPSSPEKELRRWRPTGQVWTDDNAEEIVEYLNGRISNSFGDGSSSETASAGLPIAPISGHHPFSNRGGSVRRAE